MKNKKHQKKIQRKNQESDTGKATNPPANYNTPDYPKNNSTILNYYPKKILPQGRGTTPAK